MRQRMTREETTLSKCGTSPCKRATTLAARRL